MSVLLSVDGRRRDERGGETDARDVHGVLDGRSDEARMLSRGPGRVNLNWAP
jgi:hypothetical protein